MLWTYLFWLFIACVIVGVIDYVVSGSSKKPKPTLKQMIIYGLADDETK